MFPDLNNEKQDGYFLLNNSLLCVPSICAKTHCRCDGKSPRSNGNNFDSNEDKRNGSPLLIKHKSIVRDNGN